MSIYRIDGWTSHHPHWGAAFFEADTPEAAMDLLDEYLERNGDSDDIWVDELFPRERWVAVELRRPFSFVLGSGCR